MHAKRYDRTVKPVVFGLWIKPQTNGFHEFVLIVLHFVAIGSFTADGGSTATDGEFQDSTSKTRFRDVKYARIWDTDWVDDHSDKNANDDTKHKINTKHNTKPNNVCSGLKNTWRTRENARSVAGLRSQSLFCCCHTHLFAHSHIGSKASRCLRSASHSNPMVITMSHAWVERSLWLSWSFSLTSLSSSSSPLSSSTSSCPSSSLRLSCVIPCALSPRRWGLLTLTSPSHGCGPKDYFLTETYVEFSLESMTEQRFPEDMDDDDARNRSDALWRIPKTSRSLRTRGLSSGLESSSVSQDWTGQPVVEPATKVTIERGQRVRRRSRTDFDSCGPAKDSISSLTVRRRSENTNSKLIMTEEVYRNWVKRSSRSKKNFSVLKQRRTPSARSTTSSWTVIEAKLGSSWKHMRTVLKEMEELKKFESSTFDTTARTRLVEDQNTFLELTG